MMPSNVIERLNQLIGELKMNTIIAPTEPDGPEIQPSIVLNFLIKRFEEILVRREPNIPAILHCLALAGLGNDDELLTQYKAIFSWPYPASPEIIHQAIEIFQTALQRDPDSRPVEFSPQETELSLPFCKLVLRAALREGREMILARDFRFVQVFIVLGWIGLQCDPDRLAEFQEIRASHKDDPDSRPVEFSSQETELSLPFCKLVMRSALREGREMLLGQDFRFLQVFIVLAWIGLQRDPERLAEFVEVRTSYRDDPEKVLQKGRDILFDAVFLRRPPDDSSVITSASNL